MAALLAFLLAAVATVLFMVSFSRTKGVETLALALLSAAFAVVWFVAYHPL